MKDDGKLKRILKISTTEVREAICCDANEKTENSWLWYPKNNNSGVCLVAHIDTVHVEKRNKLICYDERKRIYWSPDGLGADDRAGVWGCLGLRDLTGCMVLLTDGEEIGGIGAREAVGRWKDYFSENVKCFVELDRRGSKDAVFYNGETENFKNYIIDYGFRLSIGTFSDVSILGGNLLINTVNLSAGYYKEHTSAEYLKTPHLFNTTAKVYKIINELTAFPGIVSGWGKPEKRKKDVLSFANTLSGSWDQYPEDKYNKRKWGNWGKYDYPAGAKEI